MYTYEKGLKLPVWQKLQPFLSSGCVAKHIFLRTGILGCGTIVLLTQSFEGRESAWEK
jgi:hypothetical protein